RKAQSIGGEGKPLSRQRETLTQSDAPPSPAPAARPLPPAGDVDAIGRATLTRACGAASPAGGGGERMCGSTASSAPAPAPALRSARTTRSHGQRRGRA